MNLHMRSIKVRLIWRAFFLIFDLIKRRNMEFEDKETKICKKCGRELPLERFRLSSANGVKYYRGACRECEALYDKEYSRKKMEKEFTLSDTMKFHITREYKEISPERILDIDALNIIPYTCTLYPG